MKKSFVYLIIVLMLATMLCACGMDAEDGVIENSPKPTDTIRTSPTMMPQVSPTIIPDNSVGTDSENSTGNKSPQVGETDGVRVSPKVSDNNF